MPLIHSGVIAFATPPNRTFQATRHATPKRPKRGKVKGGGTAQQQRQARQGSAATSQGVYLPTDVAFKTFILTAVKDMHGEVGSLAYPVDVLSWNAVSGEGRLRVPARYVGYPEYLRFGFIMACEFHPQLRYKRDYELFEDSSLNPIR